ncbi:Transmembrane protein [Lachnellula suecica]|uniref:Transmembrane protein n=1 Tax=Lachnellula suecica TaxID=602035 RepID=A0A8T9CIX9_9HELO|nr:Transmembrane protein [Lachnellula suecica]
MFASISINSATLKCLLCSSAGKALVASAICWILAFQYCRLRYWREPHSAFFQSEHVYDLQYSKFREGQAHKFIETARDPNMVLGKALPDAEICAAFVTVKRESKQYIDDAIGSMLEGLANEERRNLYVYVLFANTDPTVHPSWNQSWLNNAIDAALSYNVGEDVMGHLRELEEKRDFYDKGVFDYLYALDYCYRTGAPYIAIFEDDIILADGWMAKTRQALRRIEKGAGKGGEFWNWVYLRLFYTETAIEWQSTDFMYRHMAWIFSAVAVLGYTSLLTIRCCVPSSRRHLDNWAIGVMCLVTIPAFIALVFMVGKNSLYPSNGVFKMNKHGCCTQALVFPRGQVLELGAYLSERGRGQTDTIIEDYSDARGKQRLALRPQLVQHVGLQSSRDNEFINSQSTWAFWFEEYDPDILRKEHEVLSKGMED